MEQEIDNLDKIIVRIYKLSNTERNIYNNVKEIKEEMCLSQKSSDKTLLLFELIKKEYDKLAKKYKSTSPELYIDFQQAIALIVKKNKSYTVKIKMIRGKIREIRTRIEKQGATTTAKKKLN